jgi:hypothetical protein
MDQITGEEPLVLMDRKTGEEPSAKGCKKPTKKEGRTAASGHNNPQVRQQEREPARRKLADPPLETDP